MRRREEKTFCSKRSFKNKKEAKTELERVQKYPSKIQRRELLSVYKCENCNMWHLTSMPKKIALRILKKKKERESLTDITPETIEKRLEYLKNSTKIRWEK